MKRLAIATSLALAACGTPAAKTTRVDTTAAPIREASDPTEGVDEVLARATTTTARPSRSRSRPRVIASATAGTANPLGEDFWWRLAMCESGMRVTHNNYVGFFQFSRDTAAKVGIDGSEDYETQRAAAQEWARRIHPREGTSSGWPVCWWKAAS